MAKIIKFEQISSTNKYALENIDNIEADSVIAAETQDAGRGRFSRKWISDKKGNCYISYVLKPDLVYRNHFPNLTQYLSVILCRELKKYNLQPNIKWPNDVQVNEKKIAGILSEVAFSGNNFKGIVLGIGVNLNLSQEDLNKIDIPATSVNLETKCPIDSDKFIGDFVNSFFEGYEEMLHNGFAMIRAEYLSYCNFIGKEITIKNPEPTTLGTAIGISDDGALEIITPMGETQKIISGDVILN
ncbi:MAG: biotin--[acetyl-CoA-carboxylase] ligase [bacterium]|nr:biotin--[acetyl-CoA-carboxylase] ligase [bacterium]